MMRGPTRELRGGLPGRAQLALAMLLGRTGILLAAVRASGAADEPIDVVLGHLRAGQYGHLLVLGDQRVGAIGERSVDDARTREGDEEVLPIRLFGCVLRR